jgi:hypothetical protein
MVEWCEDVDRWGCGCGCRYNRMALERVTEALGRGVIGGDSVSVEPKSDGAHSISDQIEIRAINGLDA